MKILGWLIKYYYEKLIPHNIQYNFIKWQINIWCTFDAVIISAKNCPFYAKMCE